MGTISLTVQFGVGTISLTVQFGVGTISLTVQFGVGTISLTVQFEVGTLYRHQLMVSELCLLSTTAGTAAVLGRFHGVYTGLPISIQQIIQV